ncbi:ALF repeat-containing protein [Streptomyces globisporus]|uniref:ALF repeat-containing protein n=1 Tax=Streptomyces globisporus TaxID=1908 RepID=UPI0034601FA4
MRSSRWALVAAAGALAPALLLSTPALAAAPAAPAPATVAASPFDDMDIDDLRVAVARILGDPDSGRRVIQEANALLDSGTAEEMRAWLKTGYRLAQAEDDRVAIARILADPGISDALRAAAGAALDDSTPEVLRYFLETGQYEIDNG